MGRHTRFAMGVVVCVVLSMAAIASAADFNGTWKGSADFPDGQTRELTYTLKVESGKLTGTIESPRGKVDIADGKVKGDEFSFNTIRDGNTTVHEGKWVDGKIKIKVHAASGDREYALARAEANTAPVAASSANKVSAANINGQWKGTIKDENGGDIDLTYDFKVDGKKLTGTVEGPIGKLDLEEGAAEGNQLKFQVSFNDLHILHEATVADGKIKITAKLPQGDREYTITRVIDLAGAWETKFTTPDGTDVLLKYDFKIDGQKLTGTVESPRGKLDLKEGKVDGKSISYKVTIAGNDVSYAGELADGKIKVKSQGGPFGDREYVLTRTATK